MEIQATFRHLQPTEALERQIFESARSLNQLTGQELTFCHVVVEGRPRGQRESNTRVRIAILGTRGALGVTHDLHVRATHERPEVALAEAFDSLEGQILAERARREARERASTEGRPRVPSLRRAVWSWA